MRKLISLFVLLIMIISCTQPQKQSQLQVKDTIAIERVTIDYLLDNNWEIQQTKKLYYPMVQDTGMLYQLVPDSVGLKYYYTQYTFHIIKRDTFISYYDGSVLWYPINLNNFKLRNK